MPKSTLKQRDRIHLPTLWLSGCAALFFCSVCPAQTTNHAPLIPISIIIDDLGDLKKNGLRAIQLPGNVTYAVIPYTPHSQSLARTAHRLGKEVMVHMPMESMDDRRLGRGGLRLTMAEQEFKQTLKAGIAAIPYASGLNNHMGSLLTRHPGHMQWLMDILNKNGQLYFIDSRTTAQTVALQLAQENRIPSRQRDIFLDNDPSPAAVAHQFKRLVAQAKKMGTAIAIGHPHDATLALLERQIPQLETLGLKLVPVSELLNPVTQPEQPQTLTSEQDNPDHLITQLINNKHTPVSGHLSSKAAP